LQALTEQPLYAPSRWPGLAEKLAQFTQNITPPAAPPGPKYGLADQAVVGIRGSDATFHANSTEEYLPILLEQNAVSKDFSDVGYFSIWPSAVWKLQAKERYWGNFNVQTKHPILYINGEHDPVTPIVGAYNGSAGFTGSVVLPHNGYGHGVFFDPSECVQNYSRQYFIDGNLPPNGTRCEPDQTPAQIWRATVQAAAAATNGTNGGNGTTGANGTTQGGSSNGTSTNGTATGNGAVGMGSSGSVLSIAMALVMAIVMIL
jgi:hypothetical protein